MEQKCITIRDDQGDWLRKSFINLSRLVQDAIDREMKKTGLLKREVAG